jgi:ankyrin repeat protein
VKALVEPSCNLFLQDRTARTVLHIALDARLQDVIAYLLEQNAGLSATATLLPDMWSWATNETWFPKVQVATLAAHQPCTRIKGKVVDTTKESKLVEFPVAVSADCDNSNLICAVVVSVIVSGEPSSPNFLGANLSCCNQSLQKDTQDTQKDDSPGLELSFSWRSGQRVSSCLLDYHQGDEVTRILQQLTEDKDSTSTSFFLQMLKRFWNSEVFELGVECILDIYQGPLP